MKMEQVRTFAKQYGIKPMHTSKSELIRTIQNTEGNFDCYGSAYGGDCDQLNCLWREDCFDAAQKGELS